MEISNFLKVVSHYLINSYSYKSDITIIITDDNTLYCLYVHRYYIIKVA